MDLVNNKFRISNENGDGNAFCQKIPPIYVQLFSSDRPRVGTPLSSWALVLNLWTFRELGKRWTTTKLCATVKVLKVERTRSSKILCLSKTVLPPWRSVWILSNRLTYGKVTYPGGCKLPKLYGRKLGGLI